jgi:fused signal recognition particle receptor
MLSWFKKKKNSGLEDAPDSSGAPREEKQVPEDAAAETVAEAGVDPGYTQSEASRPEEQNVEPGNRKGLFKRLQERLAKTRSSLVSRVDDLFLGRKEIDAELLDELEEILITADIGVNTTLDLLDDIRNRVSRQELRDPQALKVALKERILAFFAGYEDVGMQVPATGPFVLMVVGVNGVGKTTTIGKIASKFARSGQKVLLVAADTFRAAAIEQLKIWGERVGAEVVAKEQGVDPSAVIYDGLDYAATRDFDVIIVDTAGRLHTKVNLMEELKKIKRVINKKIAGAPHEIMLILDATTGQNSISQAKLFNEAVGLTGLTLTKLDGTAKGGIVVNISHDFNIPIRFIGIGEKLEDLRDFDPREFIEALFANDSRE